MSFYFLVIYFPYKCKKRYTFQLKLIDLQCNYTLKTKFEVMGIPEVFKYLGNNSSKLQNHN